MLPVSRVPLVNGEVFAMWCWVLCISTSKLVLLTLLAGRNRFSGAKTTFSVTTETVFLAQYGEHIHHLQLSMILCLIILE